MNEATQSELKEFRIQIENYLSFLMEENDYRWKTEVTIDKPGHKLHGQKATVFHKHDDGRVNVQVRRGLRDVNNYTLGKDEYKDFKKKDFGHTPEQKKKYAALKKAAQEGKLKYPNVKKTNEVLEWGTDETVDSYKTATPGEKETPVKIKEPSTANVKPKLSLKKFKSRLKTPPNAYDSRVGGVQPAGGLSQTAGPYTGGPVGGMSGGY